MNRRNVTWLATMIVVMCFVLSTFVSLWSLRIMARQNLRELSKTLAARIYDTIGGELSEPVMVARTMCNDYFLIETLSGESEDTERVLADYLSGIKEGLGYEAAFVVSDATKRYYSYGGLNKQLDLANSDHDRWYAAFIGSGQDYDLDVDRDELSQDMWTVFVNARIKDGQGRLLGVCGVGARMRGTQSLFFNLEREYNVKINLTDANSIIQVDTDENCIGQVCLTGVAMGDSSDYVFHQLSPDRFAVTKYVDKLGWYLVVQSDGSYQRGQFINVILLNVFMCLMVLVILVLAVRIIGARTKALQNASFVDLATELLNRRAFEEEKARLALQPLKENFVYLTADLNGLKAANDNLGHAAGDELIRGAAECLKQSFGRYGKIYRIGGDEFAGMLQITGPQLQAAVENLEQTTAAWKGRFVEGISIACGYASSREFPSENLTELSTISDERMYAAKERYYQQTGKARRKG